MQPLLALAGNATRTPAHHGPLTSTLTVSVAAGAQTTRRALRELDLFAPAIRAARALGLDDRVTATAHGLRWRPDGPAGGHIELRVDVDVEPEDEDGAWLTIVTRFNASDAPTHERLLDAWPVLGPLAAKLVERAARTVQHHADDDRFDEAGPIEHARAA